MRTKGNDIAPRSTTQSFKNPILGTIKPIMGISNTNQTASSLTDASITAELRGLVLKIMGLTATQAVADALGK